MSMTKRGILGCLGVMGLIATALGIVAAMNWDVVSKNLGEAWESQSAETEATLFRLGEVMSIAAEIQREFGVKPEVTYETESGKRLLYIAFRGYTIPDGVAARDHAREIAAFAIRSTTRPEQVDSVEVRFDDASAGDSESYSFVAELVD